MLHASGCLLIVTDARWTCREGTGIQLQFDHHRYDVGWRPPSGAKPKAELRFCRCELTPLGFARQEWQGSNESGGKHVVGELFLRHVKFHACKLYLYFAFQSLPTQTISVRISVSGVPESSNQAS